MTILAAFKVLGHGIPGWTETTHFVHAQVARFYGTDLLRLEWMSLICCLILCTHALVLPSRWIRKARAYLHRYAQNRRRAVWTCVLLPIVLRVALLPAVPLKPPSVHDEFSQLLLADTLRSGRLTNHTHLFWQHFETIHEIQKPTYNSMYQPGFAAFVAVGQLLGHPWIGVLIIVGLMCGAICWMLQAWTPPAWAFGGALLVAIQIGVGSYWMNTYVGGAPAPAMAGALLFGAIPRFFRRPSRTVVAAFCFGVVLLMNTRPFEGLFLSLLAFALSVSQYRRASAETKAAIRFNVLVPGLVVLAAGAAFTLYYSWRVTNHPFKLPYEVNRETYGWPENLAILPPLKLTYRHKILADMEASELGNRIPYTTLGRMVNNWMARATLLWQFYVGPGLTLPLLFLPWAIASWKRKPLFWVFLLMLVLNLFQLLGYPQHLSAQAPVFYVLLITGMRQLYLWAGKRSIMPDRLMAGIVASVVCSAMLTLSIKELGIRQGNFWDWPHWPFYDQRASIVHKLEQLPGKHLVFVRYGPSHSPHEEWVYNAANIDRSRIVWANMVTQPRDKALRQYFAERQAWIVAPDEDPSGFLPFSDSTYYPEAGVSCVALPSGR